MVQFRAKLVTRFRKPGGFGPRRVKVGFCCGQLTLGAIEHLAQFLKLIVAFSPFIGMFHGVGACFVQLERQLFQLLLQQTGILQGAHARNFRSRFRCQLLLLFQCVFKGFARLDLLLGFVGSLLNLELKLADYPVLLPYPQVQRARFFKGAMSRQLVLGFALAGRFQLA